MAGGIEDLRGERLQALVARIAALATGHLDGLAARSIVPSVTGAEALQRLVTPLPEAGLEEAALDALEEVIALSRAQHGGFFGYVLGSGEPVAVAADLLASALNQNVTAWRSGPSAVTLERTVVGWLAEGLGLRGFGGSLTGGGSMANLIGLAMAREAKAPANRGGAQRGTVYASDQVHMSIPKALALLGLGTDSLRRIRSDGLQRMDTAALARALEEDVAAGLRPIAVVATAGTVSTGAIDPLRECARIARAHGAWVHVDGAYGALAALAEPGRFEGLDLIDSLSLDPHKWLYQPLDVGCVLFRDATAARTAFSASDPYVKSFSADPLESFAFFDESPELSRRFRALKLWLSLRFHGFERFRGSIRRNLAQAVRLAEAVTHSPDLELLARGDLSIVCFRHRGGDDAFNEALLTAVNRAGRVYLSNAQVDGRFALRACFTNHRTTDADVDAVVSEVLRAATALRAWVAPLGVRIITTPKD